jgi:hypothetical protein
MRSVVVRFVRCTTTPNKNPSSQVGRGRGRGKTADYVRFYHLEPLTSGGVSALAYASAS